jgi:outer membrane cobalamin receptor
MLFLAGSAQAKDVTGKVTYGTDAVGGIVSITGAIPANSPSCSAT